MVSRRAAADAADILSSKPQSILTPVPRGSVYGFMFPFGGSATHPHPGLVIASQVGKRAGVDKVGVIALAITHSERSISWKDNNAIVVPQDEKDVMGLDQRMQWVCLFEQVIAYFPEDIQPIKTAGGSYLGQASKAFTSIVIEAWNDYRNS